MKIEIRFRGLPTSPALRDHTLRRVHAQLSRFGSQLRSVLVRIEDINGPRGGQDKRCLINVRGPGLRLSAIEQVSDDYYVSTALAVERASHAIGRELQRTRGEKRSALSLRNLASVAP